MKRTQENSHKREKRRRKGKVGVRLVKGKLGILIVRSKEKEPDVRTGSSEYKDP